MNLEAQAQEGRAAERILDDPAFKSACLTIRADLLERFEDSRFSDDEERTEIWRKLQSLRAIENELRSVLDTGKLAEQTLLEKAKSAIGIT